MLYLKKFIFFVKANTGETSKEMISKVTSTFGVLSVTEEVVGETASLKLFGDFMVYDPLVLGEEYLGTPEGDCEQGSTIC